MKLAPAVPSRSPADPESFSSEALGAVLVQYFLLGTSAVGRIGACWQVWYGVSGQRRLDITRIVVLENREEENR
jgi:hypothetical protein